MVVLIYGRSGSGKSRSMKNLDKENTLLINVQNKPLPFKGAFRMTYVPKGNGNLAEEITQAITKTLKKYKDTNVICIDDAGYLMTQTFMRKHKQRTGSSSFDLYNEIGDDFWTLLNFCTALPRNVNVYIMMHEETSDYGEVKLKTIGRLLDQKVCLEGMVTVCLRCLTDGKVHWFQTQNTGTDISKSPEEMFENDKVENDLKLVDDTIRQFYQTA